MNRKILLLFLLLTASLRSLATIYYVDSANVSGFQNGSSWATAYTNPQTAINAAASGDSVWVAKGTYMPAANTPYAMKDGVKILGGFLNTYTSVNQRNAQANSTIFKSNSGQNIIVNTSNGLTASALLDGFTLTGSSATTTRSAISNTSVSPTIRNCVFTANAVSYSGGIGGGAIYCTGGGGLISKCTFSNNSATGVSVGGGAIYLTGGSHTIDSCTFSGNAANGSFISSLGAFGGAVYCAGGTYTVSNCTFTGNSLQAFYTSGNGTAYAGALYNSGTCNVSNCTFNANTAYCGGTNGGTTYGGAVYSTGGSITACTFTGNTADASNGGLRYGGGLYCTGGTVSGCTFTGNSATGTNLTTGNGYGGGFAVVGSTVTLTQCTLSANRAMYGAGGYGSGAVTINNSSFTGNLGSGTASYGGGLHVGGNGTVTGCIFNNNTAFWGGGIYSLNSLTGNKIYSCSFRGDSATYGGAIYNANGTATIANALFSRNVADSLGGAVYNTNAAPRIVNCTIVQNKSKAAANIGGGIYNASNSAPAMSNTILWANTTGIYNDVASTTNAKYSLIQGFPAVPASFLLAGTTDPVFVDTSGTGDYRLQSVSPCINVGRNDSIPSGITTDLAGNARITNSIVDLGAYEYLVVAPAVNLGNDTAFCAGNTLTLNARNTGSTYLWSTGATTQTIPVSTSGTYYVTVTNTAGLARDTIVVTVNPLPVVNLGNDTAICAGNTLTLNARNPGSSYIWNGGATTQTLNVTAAGSYYVTVTSPTGCKAADTIVLNVNPLPVVNLGNDTGICAGATLTLNAGNTGSTYLWKGGTTAQTLGVATAGSYYVTVTNANGCKAADTILVNVNPLPVVNLGNDTSICAGATLALNARNTGSTFVWNTGATAQSINVTTAGAYSVTVTSAGGCKGRDTINVAVNSSPVVNLGNDTTIAAGATLVLNAGNAGANYLWNTGATTQTLSVTASGNYSVRVTNSNGCTGTDAILVTVRAVGVGTVHAGDRTVTVYPNPATDQLAISCSDARLANTTAILTDAFGRTVQTVQLTNKVQTISISGMPSGIYLLRTQDGQSVKVIKQ